MEQIEPARQRVATAMDMLSASGILASLVKQVSSFIYSAMDIDQHICYRISEDAYLLDEF